MQECVTMDTTTSKTEYKTFTESDYISHPHTVQFTSNRTEVARWCKLHCTGKYAFRFDLLYDVAEFELEHDAMMFKLRWS